MAIAGPESSQLAPKGSLGSQSWAATWLRGEIRKRMWSERMVDGESNACFGVIERAEEGEVEGYAGNCFGRKERESAIAAAGAASKYVAFGSPSAERGPTESIAFQPRTCKGIACSSLPERGLQVKLRRDASWPLKRTSLGAGRAGDVDPCLYRVKNLQPGSVRVLRVWVLVIFSLGSLGTPGVEASDTLCWVGNPRYTALGRADAIQDAELSHFSLRPFETLRVAVTCWHKVRTYVARR